MMLETLPILVLVLGVCVVPGNCSCDTRGYTLRCINIHLTAHSLSTLHLSDNIKEVHLSNNQLSSLTPQLLHRFRHLHKLHITHNRIRELPPHLFKHFHNLTALSLKGNQIRELHPDVFKGLPALETLDMSDNEMGYLYEGMFRHVPLLRSLNLLNNNIRSIPDGVFTRMSHLDDLFVGHNDIATMGDAAFQNMSMNKLDLTYNRIARLSATTFKGFRIKYKVMLYFNPLECQCQDVMRYAKYFNHMHGRMWAHCHLPAPLKDKNILTAYAHTKCTLCDLKLCRNGGACKGNKTHFRCSCADQFKGRQCERSICAPKVRYVDTKVQLPSVTVLKYSDKQDDPPPADLAYLASKNKELETKLMILYAICSLELVIILCFVGLLILGKYQDWRLVKKYKQEKRTHTLTRFAHHNPMDHHHGKGAGTGGYTSTLGDRGKGYTSISQIIPAYKYDCGIR